MIFPQTLYTQNASYFKMHSPTNSDILPQGRFLIAIELPANHSAIYKEYKIRIDGKTELKGPIRVRKNMLSVICDLALKGGRHSLMLYAIPRGQTEPIKIHTAYFRVKRSGAPLVEGKTEKTVQPKNPPKVPVFSGKIDFVTSDADITGNGAKLRQEPPMIRDVRMNVRFRLKKVEIPISGYYTTNSQGQFAYRNHLNVGIKSGGFSLTFGDHFVNYDRLAFNGIRVRGVYLDYTPKNQTMLQIKAMYGQNVDHLFRPNTFPLPPSFSDAIFLGAIPKYRRDYVFFQLRLNFTKKNDYGSFSFIRSRDYADQGVIEGIHPQDNLVLSFDRNFPLAKGKGYLRFNIAAALTTLNNALGGPAQFKPFIHLNSSTVAFTLTGFPQFGTGLEMNIPLLKATELRVHARRLGASFYTFGNPYLLNNRQTLRITDRIKLMEQKLFLTLGYDYMKDNLGGQKFNTRENSSFSASFTFRWKPTWPSLTAGYRYFLGNTYSSIAENYRITNTNFFGSIQYRLKLDPITLQFVLSRNDLNLISDLATNNRQLANNLNISASYKNRTGLSLYAAQTTMYLPDSKLPQEYLIFQLWYRIQKPDIRLHVKAINNTVIYEDLGQEQRQGYQAGLDFRLKKNITLSFTAGHMPFTSYSEDREYVERFFRTRGSIRF